MLITPGTKEPGARFSTKPPIMYLLVVQTRHCVPQNYKHF